MKTYKVPVAAAFLVTVVCAAGTVWAQDIASGVDLLRTVEQVPITFGSGQGEMPPLPADFFEPGSDPFDGTVAFEGHPLGGSSACEGDLGLADTLIQRTEAPEFPLDPPFTVTVEIEMVDLSLVSTEPITVTYNGGQNPEEWDIHVSLNPIEPSLGSMDVTKTHDNGGTYDVVLVVYPKFTFTRVSDESEVELEDFSLYQNSFLAEEGVPWEYDLAGLDCPDCTSNFAPGYSEGVKGPFTLYGDHYGQTLEVSCPLAAVGANVNFTVEQGALGLGGTAVNADPDNEDDVYIGGGGTNLLRLDGNLIARLGLVAGDDIDAISYGDPSVAVNLENYGGEIYEDDGLYWHFSVDKFAQGFAPGVSPNDVFNEVNVGTQAIVIPVNPQEALGDYFFTFFGVQFGNVLAGDEELLGLDLGPPQVNSFDELNGLDLLAAPIDEPSEDFQPGQFFFSLKAGSPSLTTYGVHEADILTPDGIGGIKIAGFGDGILPGPGDHTSLGIPPDNDLDALFVDQNGMPFFSVEQTIPNNPGPDANPGDILVPDGIVLAGDGVADEFIWASTLGLRDVEGGDDFDDNLDALDVEPFPVEPSEEPVPGGGDQHAPGEMIEIWVDFAWGGLELGTFYNPFSSLGDGVNAVSQNGTIMINAGSTEEILTIDTPVRIEAVDGPVRIGVLAGSAKAAPGDVDRSASVNVVDVQLVVNEILGLDTGFDCDIDDDDVVDAVDVQLTINAALL